MTHNVFFSKHKKSSLNLYIKNEYFLMYFCSNLRWKHSDNFHHVLFSFSKAKRNKKNIIFSIRNVETYHGTVSFAEV